MKFFSKHADQICTAALHPYIAEGRTENVLDLSIDGPNRIVFIVGYDNPCLTGLYSTAIMP